MCPTSTWPRPPSRTSRPAAACRPKTSTSSFIQGGDISLKAGGDIVSQTLTRPDAGNAAHQHVLAQGRIEATGTVTAVAGNDLAIRGSTLSAGGDVTLAAGRDMTVGTVTEEFHLDGGSRSWEHRVTHTGSTVAAGGNLNMTAGRDMTVAGSQVGAGGDAQLAAGGNLSVVAVQDTFSSFVKAESGKGGLFSSSSKSTYTQDYRTSKSSTVASGGNLSLLAGVTGLTPGASAASGAPAS
ncbi:MAG: hemagglutinin repeat-containing protein, partial [Desulfovibrio sp.]|nr:hemagglutinin repeat-containing protein [Desulfovibrio sp.]